MQHFCFRNSRFCEPEAILLFLSTDGASQGHARRAHEDPAGPAVPFGRPVQRERLRILALGVGVEGRGFT